MPETTDKQDPQTGSQFSVNQEDLDFANEARKLLNDIKNILKNAKLRMQHESGTDINTDTQEAEKSIHDADGTLNRIMAGAFSISANASVNILA